MKNFPRKVNSGNARARSARLSILAILLLLCVCCVFFACKKNKTNGFYAEVTDDFKTEYYVGDAFVAAGSLKAYSDKTHFDLIPITADMVTGFDTSAAGDVILTVTYGEFVATVPIRVSAVVARVITLNADTVPSVIFEGDPFPSGVTFSVEMSDGTTRPEIPVTVAMLGGFNSSFLGNQNITVTYLGATTSFSVLIKEDEYIALSLVGAKAEYAVNEPFSAVGASLLLTYESGKTAPATMTPELITAFTTALGGEHRAKVSYGGLTCDYLYYVRKEPISFELVENTLPLFLEKNDLFPSGVVGIVTYDDTSIDMISVTSKDVSDFDTSVAGEGRACVTVFGISSYYSYTVLPAIESATPYGYTSAVLQGAGFDGLGELIVVYEDGARESIALSSDRLTVSYTTAVAGEITQTIRFRQEEIPFTVRVYSEDERDSVDRIELAGVFPPIKIGESLNVFGVQVWVVYRYMSPITVACDPAWASVSMPETIEEDFAVVPVTVSLLGVSADASVRVLSEEYAESVTALAVMGVKDLYVVGDVFSPEYATLSVTYGGGYDFRQEVPLEESFVTQFNTATPGERKMTITYEGYEIEVPYRVISENEKSQVTDFVIEGFAPLLFEGDDIFDIDVSHYALDVTLGYGYSAEVVSLSAEMLSGGPFDEPGQQTIEVTYQGISRTFYVNVRSASEEFVVTSISVLDTIYGFVGTPPDFSAAELEVTYGYGREIARIPLSSDGVMISAFSTESAGFVQVEVFYAGVSCTAFLSFTAGESENVLQKIEIAEDSRRTFAVGEVLDGVWLIAMYNGEREPERIVVLKDAMAADFRTDAEGVYSITISYGGKAVVYRYEVTSAEEPEE